MPKRVAPPLSTNRLKFARLGKANKKAPLLKLVEGSVIYVAGDSEPHVVRLTTIIQREREEPNTQPENEYG